MTGNEHGFLLNINMFCAKSLSAFTKHYFYIYLLKLSNFIKGFEVKYLMKNIFLLDFINNLQVFIENIDNYVDAFPE